MSRKIPNSAIPRRRDDDRTITIRITHLTTLQSHERRVSIRRDASATLRCLLGSSFGPSGLTQGSRGQLWGIWRARDGRMVTDAKVVDSLLPEDHLYISSSYDGNSKEHARLVLWAVHEGQQEVIRAFFETTQATLTPAQVEAFMQPLVGGRLSLVSMCLRHIQRRFVAMVPRLGEMANSVDCQVVCDAAKLSFEVEPPLTALVYWFSTVRHKSPLLSMMAHRVRDVARLRLYAGSFTEAAVSALLESPVTNRIDALQPMTRLLFNWASKGTVADRKSRLELAASALDRFVSLSKKRINRTEIKRTLSKIRASLLRGDPSPSPSPPPPTKPTPISRWVKVAPPETLPVDTSPSRPAGLPSVCEAIEPPLPVLDARERKRPLVAAPTRASADAPIEGTPPGPFGRDGRGGARLRPSSQSAPPSPLTHKNASAVSTPLLSNHKQHASTQTQPKATTTGRTTATATTTTGSSATKPLVPARKMTVLRPQQGTAPSTPARLKGLRHPITADHPIAAFSSTREDGQARGGVARGGVGKGGSGSGRVGVGVSRGVGKAWRSRGRRARLAAGRCPGGPMFCPSNLLSEGIRQRQTNRYAYQPLVPLLRYFSAKELLCWLHKRWELVKLAGPDSTKRVLVFATEDRWREVIAAGPKFARPEQQPRGRKIFYGRMRDVECVALFVAHWLIRLPRADRPHCHKGLENAIRDFLSKCRTNRVFRHLTAPLSLPDTQQRRLMELRQMSCNRRLRHDLPPLVEAHVNDYGHHGCKCLEEGAAAGAGRGSHGSGMVIGGL
ncbi:unnamed protein product [Vitrella brassicaformis CCMP3155]|uniref:Uncharacterized protein n=2 Tax=Vitrella brassicaformis TaxID=1169539 RepID=A0A0G4G3R1_VITBC|nr:unnamed protein product [Vitrella brassicaformis CCMP3155]|eukprot:CEM22920.1 unnamed protein product [Vitrella brassicaformis CCMP3155]